MIDEQPGPGGQIYRGVETASPLQRRILGPDYTYGGGLVAEFRVSGAEYRPGTQVWRIGADGTLDCSAGGSVRARRVLLATGALERPLAFPGWTLPGVMTAGAAQIMVKTGGVLPAGRVVMAGTGPLLMLVAAQLLEAGVDVVAVAETTRPGARLKATVHARPGLLADPTLHKGLSLLGKLRRHGVRQIHSVRRLEALGSDRLTGVRLSRGRGAAWVLPADLLLVHFGVVPDIQAARSAGLAVHWDERQLAFRPQLDDWGRSANPMLMAAGDGAGITGAVGAALRGRLAALDAAAGLGRITQADRDRLAQPLQAALAREMRVRPLLDQWFRPARDLLRPADEAVVCRCESLTARQLRVAAQRSGPDADAVKAVTRCGMGPCGGRMCGAALARLTAEAHGMRPEACVPPRVRAPIRPVRLGMLAGAV